MATTYVDQISGSGSSPTPVDQITGSGETVAYKAPCRLAALGNVTLDGLQTIDGEMTAADDRVLVRAQTDAKQNGIWIAAAGPWQRARDFDSNRDITKGTRVTVTDGSTLAGKEYQITSENPIAVGSSIITFAETLSSDAGSAAAAAQAAQAAAEEAQAGAESAAGAAAGFASAASTSAGNAATSESNAAGSAGDASGYASAASGSAGAASTSAGNAATSETNAGNAKTAAEAAQSAAEGASALAEKWAGEEEDVEVAPGRYSAKHWAAKSQESASEVTSVNGQTGTVVLNAADVGAAATSHTHALADLGNGAAVSVVGRSANSSGARADIAASTNDRILARVSNAISWVQITIGMIPDGLITFAKMASAALAAAADIRAGTASKLVDAAGVHSSMAWVALTAGSAPAVDHAAGFNRTITHTQNATMGAPSNAKPGMPLNFDITPGAFTTSWHANYKFGSAGAPSITARTLVHFICRDSSTYVFLGTSEPS